MMIRAQVYKAFPSVDHRVVDAWELWEIGVKLGNDVGASPSDEERDELVELQRKRSERMRAAAERRKAGG